MKFNPSQLPLPKGGGLCGNAQRVAMQVATRVD